MSRDSRRIPPKEESFHLATYRRQLQSSVQSANSGAHESAQSTFASVRSATNCDEIFWWKCTAKGHEWQMSVEKRAINGRGCPDCATEKLANEDSLAAVLPPLAKLWHPTRNLPVRPTDIVPGSTFHAWWRCPKSATHVWKAHVYSVVRSWKDGNNGCRWCKGLSADEKNSLQSKCPTAAKLWHPTKNGKLLPSQVTWKSNKKVWWHCGKPKHEFQAVVANMVTAVARGNGCKFCSGHCAAPDNCLKRVCPSVAKMWHPTKNGKVTASDVTRDRAKNFIGSANMGTTGQPESLPWCNPTG